MTINKQQVKKHLQEFDFPRLFTQELGWDHHKATLTITVNNQDFNLHAAAEKRGMSAFVLEGDIPDYPIRRKIERQVTKSAHEHLIIYVDPDHTTQIWQWVKREPGKPVACREHTYYKGQSGESLVQRLELLLVTLEEEPDITTLDIANRARDAFNVDRVTKRFFDLFKNEHKDFLDFIKGIPDDEMQRWYASVMLNRLMFVYFIQKKGFLDSNINYLKDKLDGFLAKGTDKYYSNFLCPLFFAGFAIKEEDRSARTNKLLGKVPYLNGGIFQKHQIEQLHGKDIQIPDRAFTALFDFFERYQWHLDERPLRADNEINPDVLGYIFEKYINQKQMGAYYTKEDITGYISKNTIIPYLFDAARKKCKIAFEGEQSIWNLLTSDPDRYFYPAVKHGIDNELPKDIDEGIADVSKCTKWNTMAPDTHALPTEIWREVVARRQRYEEIRNKLTNGEVRDINDLITYNLDICQFAQDVVENCEGPELLRAIWKAIEKITVLDPTCGSGAFLFAALNILEPLYEACLDRMQVFLDELERSGEKHRPEKFSDFRKILARIDEHPNRRYFILKSIILNNLYGVDIMDEAIEICKLRLFLKMVAQIENLDDLEPLPDIDFNIRAGNTLVGYASFDEVQRAAESDLLKQQRLPAIKEKAKLASVSFDLFHKQQTEEGSSASEFANDKRELQERLSALELELNKFLADEYHDNTSSNPKRLKSWIKSHKPFHWCIEFYRIIWNGGFDIIIGNPPYVEYTKIKLEYTLLNYDTISCGNLYAYVLERSLRILHQQGRVGMIVPLSSVSTPRMAPLSQLYKENDYKEWLSFYAGDSNPGQLFNGVKSQFEPPPI